MRGRSVGAVVGVGLLGAVVLVLQSASPAGAPVLNTCPFDSNLTVADGQPSQLTAGHGAAEDCTLAHATAVAASSLKIEDFAEATVQAGSLWHFGAARKVVTSAATAKNGLVITANAGHFAATDVDHPVSGPGIPTCAFIASVTATTATLNVPTTGVPSGATLLVENSDGRCFRDTTFSSGSTTLVSLTAHFRSSDVGRLVRGANLPHGTHITSWINATHVTISQAASGAGAGLTESIMPLPPIGTGSSLTSSTRQVNDASMGSDVVCSKTARFVATDIGLPVLTATGTELPGGPYWITKIGLTGSLPCSPGESEAFVQTPFTVGGAGQRIVIGEPNRTAPKNGDIAAYALMNFDSPAAFGPDPFGIPTCGNQAHFWSPFGLWRYRGSFQTAITYGPPSAAAVNQPIVGQIVFVFGAATVAGYIEPIPPATPGESDVNAHYDLVFPAWPSACNEGTQDEYFSVNVYTQTPDQTEPYLTTGTPGTNMIRRMNDLPGTMQKTTTGYLHIKNSANAALYNDTSTCRQWYPTQNSPYC